VTGETRKLRDVCLGIFDGPHATPPKADEGPVFLGISNLNNGRLDLSEVEHIAEAHFTRWTKRVTPRTGDLVFSYETRLGQAALIPEGLRCCLGRRLGLLRPDPTKVDPRFLLYSYIGPEFQEFLETRILYGSTVDRLPITEFPDFAMLVPPLAQQQGIAAVLGSLDDKIELNRRMNHTLEEMASVLFERLMIGVDDDPALDVSVQSLIDRQLLVVGDGYRAKNEELASEGLPFARAGNIDAGFRFDDTELLGWPAVTSAGTKVSVPFDVVFTSKGTVGRFAFVSPTTPKFAYSPQLCFWRSVDHDVLSPFFLYHWMRSSRFLEQVDAVKGQTDMADYVSLTDQRLMKIACPKCDDHRRLRDDVAMLWELHFANTDESKTLSALRDALLPQVLSGEITLKAAEKTVAEVV
jgi:type I restriction enzyme, S subunit